MSGHSKWATTKHRKAAQDAKRSALFSKLTRVITVAAREGGDPNPDNNAALAAAIAKAKGYSLPKDKIDLAIKKAFSNGGDSANFESVTYEGNGPCGVKFYLEALTDNRNRTAADVRSAFTHSGGELLTSGSVAFLFQRRGQITLDKTVCEDEDELMMAVAEAGGDDYEDADEEWVVWTQPGDLMPVKKGLEEQGLEVKGAELVMQPNTPKVIDNAADARKVLRLVDKLEDLDDLQSVYHNMEMTDEVAEEVEND
ncbi:MAG: YebC/PmpR family DNA-binding transcriptional regulator [Coriobacteriales bacterium]|nr:YebC/PmpR family DNA-binding transcriptional regulator [Coriobacteriales bacterium]